jgi:hypothetical protein
MHIQAKAKPAASPPDLETFLAILSEPVTPPGEPDPRQPINVEGISGDDLELGGEFIFSFDHERQNHVRDWLREAGYRVRFLEGEMAEIGNGSQVVDDDTKLAVFVLDGNTPGTLLNAIRSLGSANLPSGRVIRHMVLGQETQPPNRFYVQIAFQEVKRA